MENSHIQWTDHTFNPWIGCTKVSPGCRHCYAEALNKRWRKGQNWGPGAPRQRTSVAYWREPLKWNNAAIYSKCGEDDIFQRTRCLLCGGTMRRPRVFCASLADWLDDEVQIEWLYDLLKLIRVTPNLDWLLLTKRPGQFWNRMKAAHGYAYGVAASTPGSAGVPHDEFCKWLGYWLNVNTPPSNVWIGTTVEDQARADERIPKLLAIPAKVRFLSCEPLFEAVRIEEWLISHSRARADLHERRTGHDCGAAAMVFTCDECGLTTFSEKDQRIHWVICGGESGPGARPMHPDWARSLRDQCTAAGVPFFMKQLGRRPVVGDLTHWRCGAELLDDGSGYLLELKDRAGGDITEWPEDLRVRQFPATEVTA